MYRFPLIALDQFLWKDPARPGKHRRVSKDHRATTAQPAAAARPRRQFFGPKLQGKSAAVDEFVWKEVTIGFIMDRGGTIFRYNDRLFHIPPFQWMVSLLEYLW